ncbi:ATP-dependent DNA helicase [Byssothecium circinans]|uniref:ATP-dependent DNA helicase n=1 Tax=Byssothecium circinans TaxID=147558 RepID=A0A6A5U932_9PLEO|nr:ATP-dependent DNA helicase [Byssothecium circinans]
MGDIADAGSGGRALALGKRSRDEDDNQAYNGAATSSTKRNRPESSTSTTLANKVLKEQFKLDGFRGKQEEAITRLLDGKSAIIVFPTGAGKSLCYQVPAVAFKYQDEGVRTREKTGITLVISPLIALMKDQVDALLRRNIKASLLNSSISRDQFVATQHDLRNGSLDLLYCAPERLNSEGFIASLKAIPGGIRLLAVDEAHCISEWGHSFRPDYLKIARFAKEAEVERVACLTATATPQVAEDIRKAFDIPPEGLFSTTTYRPNLRLLAEAIPKGADYVGKLVKHLRKHPGPTIVYVTIQKDAESLAEELATRGFQARAYHAGMKTDDKDKIQDEFLRSNKMIIVATIAFGMGIDKPDIRNIIHFDTPSSIEAYSQQIGRAGRDGKPSTCLFYLSTNDFYLRNIFTYGDRPSYRSLKLLMNDIVERAKNTAVGEVFEVSHYSQSRDVDIGTITLSIIFAHLELKLGYFRAAGAIYKEYKYIPNKPSALSSDSAPIARAILRAAKAARKWTVVTIDDVANSLGVPRNDIVRKLDEWNERGFIHLEKSRVENLYRLARPLPTTPAAIDQVIRDLDEIMEAKENQDLNRTQAIVKLITDKKCYARALADYFGEPEGSSMARECGHCTWCETHVQVLLPNEPPQPPDPPKVKAILEKIAARDDPRFLAKIAFGVRSPRITAEKIVQMDVFESMNVCDFPELLRVFTEECAKA